jgi:RNA polymerase sigma-70 factor (ECF subfamily)
MTDEELVQGVRGGDGAQFEVLMRRYNRRIFRVARAIVRSDDEAEDVAQQAYVNAFVHLDQFEARARFSTWLTRIAIYEALARVRKAKRMEYVDDPAADHTGLDGVGSAAPDPEEHAYRGELAAIIEHAVSSLPESFRTVFMLRDVEGLSTQETAECLGLNDDTVKTRLHRARARMRRALVAAVGASAATAFQFDGARCDRLVSAVMARLETRPTRTDADGAAATGWPA